uniref:DNA repair and recombination protein RAD54B-like isoform X3 n=1 Tax=Oncorhynchus gorbuscha TaxID=8017 RepID=UPI001EAF4D58|nr:DNA repair and recombination protein RAD54B-like isoform X3 [Oncorhynchus gorbuscha]
MRRSGAPSQVFGNMAKKPRFVPPGASLAGPPDSPVGTPLELEPLAPKLAPGNVLYKVQRSLSAPAPPLALPVKAFSLTKSSPQAPGLSRALARVLGAADSKKNELEPEDLSFTEENTGDPADFRCSSQSPAGGCGPVGVGAGSGSSAGSDGPRYFSVMWCKASGRKHKRWQGDAVLVTRGRTATLKDMEGKDIGKGSGYKVSELASLGEGETLMIGAKQVEVMGLISELDYNKGRGFLDVHVEKEEPKISAPPPSRRPASKPFCRPTLLGGETDRGVAKPQEEGPCKPRHDPLAPGAIVMPRPSTNHQWAYNKAGLPLVDVVVDPYLTAHLRPHQRDGLLFLYECVMGMRATCRYGAILADEMGLGKTLQSVALTWTLLKQGPYGGKPVAKLVLVVAPGSLVQNWGAEFKKWLGRERINVYTVNQDHRVELFAASPLHSVLVISYEMLLRSLEVVQKLEFGLVICDEGHRLKNSSIKTSSALSGLSCTRRVILTGTPVQNDLQEFYSIIEFVNPGILGSSAAYRKVYEEPILRSRQPICTEERSDGSSAEGSLYEGLRGVFPESYSSGGFSTADSGKLLVLSDLLTTIHHLSPTDRVVLVSNYTQTLDLIQDLCVHLGYTYCRLDGNTPTIQRQRLVDNFNSPHSAHFLFLLSSKAGGVGLNLIGASHLVLYDIDWNPANDIQAMSRVWRDGQKKTVHIYRLLTAGTIEERIFQRQVSKQGLSGTVVDLGKGAEHTSFSSNELRDLFSLTDTPCLTHDLLHCSCSMDGSAPEGGEDAASDRPCQLGRQGDRGGAGQKHLSMSELMQWRHFAGDTHTFRDAYLDHARTHISFAFQSTISHTTQ